MSYFPKSDNYALPLFILGIYIAIFWVCTLFISLQSLVHPFASSYTHLHYFIDQVNTNKNQKSLCPFSLHSLSLLYLCFCLPLPSSFPSFYPLCFLLFPTFPPCSFTYVFSIQTNMKKNLLNVHFKLYLKEAEWCMVYQAVPVSSVTLLEVFFFTYL